MDQPVELYDSGIRKRKLSGITEELRSPLKQTFESNFNDSLSERPYEIKTIRSDEDLLETEDIE